MLAARPMTAALGDAAVAIACFGGSLALIAHGGIGPSGAGSGQLDPVSVSLAAAASLPLIAWRRFPLGVFAATAGAGVLLVGLGYSLDLLLGSAVALYLLAASRDQASTWTRANTAAVAGLLVSYVGAAALAQEAFPASELLHTGLAWAVAWFAGERTRLRREQIADLEARALRNDRDAERERLLATAEERTRIARDLHDSAGHAINVIAVQAGAARLRHRQDPDRSLVALKAIEGLARQTAAEIDQMVGTLRDERSPTDTVAPPIGLASVDTLIAGHRESGLDVTIETGGTPRLLSVAVDQAAYRILQEALTNAARHGGGSARVTLVYADDLIDLTVSNPVGRSRGTSLPTEGGHGLVGMRERAHLLGGTLDAGGANGTFRLRARVPYGGHPA